MRISPVSNNQPNFQALNVSKDAIRGLKCSEQELLKNDFINKWVNEYDINIQAINTSFFKKPTEFMFEIGKNVKNWINDKFTFNSIEELDTKTKELNDDFNWKHVTTKYDVILNYFEKAEDEDYYSFISHMDELMPAIAAIPNDKDHEKLNTYFLSVLKKLPFWKPLFKCNADVALLALNSNNLELLKFLKSKGENLNKCLDLVKTGNVSEEAKEILKDVKYQDPKVFDLEKCYFNKFLVEQFFKENPNIDINSRDENGDTPVLKAVRENNTLLIDFFKNLEGVNWNTYDANGDNCIMLALKQETVAGYMLTILSEIPNIDAGAACINLLNSNRPIITPLEFTAQERHYYQHHIMKFKNINVMEKLYKEDQPFIFRSMLIDDYNCLYRTRLFVGHKSFDINFMQDIITFVQRNQQLNYMIEYIQKEMPNIITNEAIKIYNKNGYFTLEELDRIIEMLVKNNGEKFIETTNFNIFEEGYGHMLAEIPIDPNDFNQMSLASKILKRLDSNYKVTVKENILGENMFQKAAEAENIGLIKLILKQCPLTAWRIKNCCKNSDNPEIRKLVE